MRSLEILSSPDTGPYWISPLYRQESREMLAGLVWNVIEDDGYDYRDGKYRILDIGGGSGLLSEEVAVKHPESYDKDHPEVFADILDMAPPDYVRALSEEHDNIDLTQGIAPGDIPGGEEEYDFVSLINTGQYFDDDEFSSLVDEIHSSLVPGGYFLFNSIHSLTDLFRDLEELSDEEIVVYEDGETRMETDVRIDKDEFDLEQLGVEETLEQEMTQSPRRFVDYLMEILDGERFSAADFGSVEAFTDAEGLAKCIESITYDGESDKLEPIENKTVEYPWGMAKKLPDGS